ncbi:MAG: lmo0937 family membrane protein [Ginsengibacter sp.]
MRGLLYIIAVILVIIWAASFLMYHVTGGLIHILLVIAVISVILGIIRKA